MLLMANRMLIVFGSIIGSSCCGKSTLDVGVKSRTFIKHLVDNLALSNGMMTGVAMVGQGRSSLSVAGWWVCWLSKLLFSDPAVPWLLHQWLTDMVWRRALPCDWRFGCLQEVLSPLPFQWVSQWHLRNKESRATPSLPTFPILAPVLSIKIWPNIYTYI